MPLPSSPKDQENNSPEGEECVHNGELRGHADENGTQFTVPQLHELPKSHDLHDVSKMNEPVSLDPLDLSLTGSVQSAEIEAITCGIIPTISARVGENYENGNTPSGHSGTLVMSSPSPTFSEFSS
ncbi:uncharacterized protein LOC107036909 [Diachasma alloeum]|uniref:uncharacterized protein LOC107036909 n=1 Tax=Diachasma alloeum TaxID=454923 RepID=UPI000738361E|nr:uncharacterized protein LOC107036909 [Diachasma alloeum]